MSDLLHTVIADELSALRTCLADALPNCRVFEEYEYRRAAALSVASLTLGVKAVRLSEGYLAKVAGYASGALTLADTVEVDYAVTVHCPVADGGDAGRLLQTKAADALRWGTGIAFARLVTGAPTYDRISRCLRFPLTVTVRYLL
ncbi:MAG: hypothetical protein J6X61_02715 [Clostridia bacterium]|nr:hypothetical protein [Clostridia bacterium]